VRGPARKSIPYARQTIEEDDIAAVVEVLRSDWLTTGPKIAAFERAVARFTGAPHAVALTNGTAALHGAMFAGGIGPGDEVIVPAMTFAATANAVVFQGGTPVFVDVDPDTLLLDPAKVETKINPRTKAIVAVDYAGQPCDYDALVPLAQEHGLLLIADSAHALGGEYKGRRVGTLADLTTLSFHPVKQITTGEGGMVTTARPEFSEAIERFRNHGITSDHRSRAERGTWFYEMVDLGYNYRITDLQCALGVSQLKKLPRWIARRRAVARRYDRAFASMDSMHPLSVSPDVKHAYHLYVVRLALERLKGDRATAFSMLREKGVNVNVHYIPVHLHPFYRKRFGTGPGLCPVAEHAYERVLSLPMYASLSDGEVDRVIEAMEEVLQALAA
jgi:perosamine synthetase